MKRLENMILVDYHVTDNWEFRRALEEETKENWIIDYLVTNTKHKGWQNLIRYFLYFCFPIKILLKIKRYKNIVAWQQFFGLILAAYLRFFHMPSERINIYVMEMIYKSKKGIVGKIYERFIRYAITSEYIKRIFVFSEKEKELYCNIFDVSENRMEVLQLGIEDSWEDYSQEIHDGGYYIAAGRSNRDYDFLINVWKSEYKLKIICDDFKCETEKNIEVLKNCYNDKYMKELAGCHAVIIPLLDKYISSGQLVALQSMMLGKPVIVIHNDVIKDYIVDDFSGYIIEKDPKLFWSKIRKLENKMEYDRISRNARMEFEKGFSVLAMGKKVGSCINKDKKVRK